MPSPRSVAGNVDNEFNRGERANRQGQLGPAKVMFLRCMGYSFDTIEIDDVVGGFAIHTFTLFTTAMGENPPKKPRGGGPYATDTLKGYVRSLAHSSRQRFNGDPLLVNEPELLPTESINKMLELLEGDNLRNLMQGKKESDVHKNTFPLPRKHSEATRILPLNDFTDATRRELSREWDFYKVCKTLMQREEFTKHCKLVVTNNAIGRGGEAKFLPYDKMFLDLIFGICFFQWFTKKELKTTPSGFCVDYEHPELCAFFSLGCFWALDHGLARQQGSESDPQSERCRRSQFILQDLHQISDDSVARQLTTIIRDLLPEQLKNFYTVKSLRIGAMTLLAWNAAVTFEEGVALGGWTTPSNRDWCVWMYLIAIVPPVLALGGYPDPRRIPVLPSFNVLFLGDEPAKVFDPDKFPNFLEELFVIGLKDFRRPNGRMRPMLRSVAAVMVMHFNYMESNNYGNGHAFVRRMVTAVESVGLAVSRLQAGALLRHWSHKIKDQFKRSNSSNISADPNSPVSRLSLIDQLRAINSNVAKALEDKQETQHKLNQLVQEMAQMKRKQDDAKVSQENLVLEMQNLTQALNSFNLRQNNIGPQVPATPGAIGNTAGAEEPIANGDATIPAPAAPPAPPLQDQQPAQPVLQENNAETPARLSLNDALVRTRAGTEDGRGRGVRNDKRKVKHILMGLYETGSFGGLEGGNRLEQLHAEINLRFWNGSPRNSSKIKAGLQLIDALWSKEERDNCTNKSFENNAAALDAFSNLDLWVKRAMHIFDNPSQSAVNPRRSSAIGAVGEKLIGSGRLGFVEAQMPNWNSAFGAQHNPPLRAWVMQQEVVLVNRFGRARSAGRRRR